MHYSNIPGSEQPALLPTAQTAEQKEIMHLLWSISCIKFCVFECPLFTEFPPNLLPRTRHGVHSRLKHDTIIFGQLGCIREIIFEEGLLLAAV